MTDWGTILQGLTLALVAGVGAFMKKSAEDGAKAAIRDLEFPREFLREFAEISEKIFRELLISKSANYAIEVLDYFSKGDYEQWREKGSLQGKTWREDMKKIAEEWGALDEHQRFAVLQQLGSKLRTSLSNDLESRMG